jgi:hypothetical protein
MANYKKASVVVLANATGTQVIPNTGTGVKLLWTEVADQTNNGPETTHMTNGVFTAPYDGFYHVTVSVFYGYSVELVSGSITVIKNNNLASGITLWNLTSVGNQVLEGFVPNGTRVFKLVRGDTIAIYAAHVSPLDQTPDAVNSTLSIVRVGNAS